MVFGFGGFDGGYSHCVGDTDEGYYGGEEATSPRDNEMQGDSGTAQLDNGGMEDQQNSIDNATHNSNGDFDPDSSSGSVDGSGQFY